MFTRRSIGKMNTNPVYMCCGQSTEQLFIIGMSGGTSQKEAGLADRLWTHFGEASQLRKKLFPSGIDVRECNVQTYHQADLDKRNQVERYGIASFDPTGNRKIPWQPPMPNSTSFGPMKSTILNGV
jgi:hypothetical protein